MDGVTLLLQVMTKMETPGRMPEPFTTDNKKYLHPGSCLKRYELITDEILPGSSQCTEVGESPPVFSSGMIIHARI